MTDQSGKVAIVTGASRGIAAAVAERHASDGLAMVIKYSGDVKSAEALCCAPMAAWCERYVVPRSQLKMSGLISRG
jgi:NAD(P)-dependent dehydrogenase (short-subunit alcohol dehydrogenase family)